MKKPVLIIFILLCISDYYAQIKKVLFLGNSYTSVNNLPNTLKQLSLSLGDSVDVAMYAPGGYRLMNHASDANTYSNINADIWDYVVIQAQSQEPSFPPSQLNNEVYPYAQQLVDSIKSKNYCTEPVFYMTWGRKYGDATNCASWPPVCTYLGMQERLMAGYMTMANITGGTVAPCGMAWMKVINNNPGIELYSTDNSHPAEAGTYLNACVIYATIFRKSPIGASYFGNLNQSDAVYLQNVADSIVLNKTYQYYFNDTITNDTFILNNRSWFNYGNIVISDFNFSENAPGEYIFTDSSLNANAYYWNFGDGYESWLQNPSHQYSNSNFYNVIHVSENSCFSDTSIKNIQVLVNDDILSKQNIQVIYNKISNNILIKGIDNKASYKLYSITGKLIKKGSVSVYNDNINLPLLDRGYYVFELVSANIKITKKILIN